MTFLKILVIQIQIQAVHRGSFCQFLFRWIYYCHSSKYTGKETSKTHLCAALCSCPTAPSILPPTPPVSPPVLMSWHCLSFTIMVAIDFVNIDSKEVNKIWWKPCPRLPRFHKIKMWWQEYTNQPGKENGLATTNHLQIQVSLFLQ